MSGGKGGSQKQTTEVKIDKDIKRAAMQNLEAARVLTSQEYVPYSGNLVAAFSPDQQQAMSNTRQAAQAFGLPTSQGRAGYLPAPTRDAGGYLGYDLTKQYAAAMGSLPQEYADARKQFLEIIGRPDTGKNKKNKGSKSSVDWK